MHFGTKYSKNHEFISIFEKQPSRFVSFLENIDHNACVTKKV